MKSTENDDHLPCLGLYLDENPIVYTAFSKLYFKTEDLYSCFDDTTVDI